MSKAEKPRYFFYLFILRKRYFSILINEVAYFFQLPEKRCVTYEKTSRSWKENTNVAVVML